MEPGPGSSSIPWLGRHRDVLLELAAQRWRITGVVLFTAAVCFTVLSLIPSRFTATAVIMPPQQAQSLSSAMMSQFGALTGFGATAQMMGLKSPSDLYVGILEGRTIADAVIARFQLQQVYGRGTMTETRKVLAKYTAIGARKSGLIEVSVEDQDPKRAAALANAYIEELQKQNGRLAVTDASQRRLFFEKELDAQKADLAEAERALKTAQEKSGMIQPAGQAEAIIRAQAQARAELASLEVQTQAMSTFATDENPQIKVLRSEQAAVKEQLRQLEGRAGGASGSALISSGNLPAAGLEYMRRLRDVKYHEALFELIAKQCEAARLDEAKSAPVLQVVDSAVVPDRKSWPPRGLLSVAAGAAAFFLCCAWVIVRSLLNFKLEWPRPDDRAS
ncbi:Wzz/FepE/Etk N-terminal domain-containing protein [uncultured Paludibaculum sp.]|uniref:GumC family protein n=1 Tax=uncultured Paludibaculum sp. TaxID=1765020 RepID=UPI002AAAE1D3|nr:Wzz/FepE/Etk N-terminal domain-containing protein [uncultured Paludibaculum sp.]